ncbi:MAG: hypothetical protein HY812_11130 [Planctomycetes bacterium]|nr:hypothetical protein [Planctomycetota bacterium]
MKSSSLAFLFALLTWSSAPAATWIVDASGGGDFLTIQAAIDQVAAGDVLLVEAGIYGAFQLKQDLSILGRPGGLPKVNGTSLVETANAHLAGLEFVLLEIKNSSGRIVLDDCAVSGQAYGASGCWHALLVDSCNEVHVSRSAIDGKDGDYYCEGTGVVINDSRVTLTRCVLSGGDGWGDTFTGYDGQPALDVRGSSEVLIAGTDCFGGDGGTPQILFGGQGGDGAEAACVGWSTPLSRLTIRGNQGTDIRGGQGGGGDFAGGDALWAVGGYGTLVISGVAAWPQSYFYGLNLIQPNPAQSFIEMTGGDGPLATKRLNLWGPPGNVLWLLASLQPAWLAVGGIDGPFLLDPPAILIVVPIPTKGQNLSENVLFQLPASLVGLEDVLLTFQGFATGLGANGDYLATNPAQFLVRR